MHLLVVMFIMVQTGVAGNNFIKEKEEAVSSETELPIKRMNQHLLPQFQRTFP
jgi:hypothetical protein